MERDQQASAPQAGLAGTASSFVPTATDARACLVDLRAREHAVVHEQFEMLVEEKRKMALNGEIVTAQYFDHRGVYLVTLTYTFGEAGAPQGAAARPAGGGLDCNGEGARSSPSAGISGRRLNNWKKKHCADDTLRPGAGMRVAARTAKRRACLPARQEATVAPRSSPAAAGKPRANASSRAQAKPAQTRTSSESDSDEDSELPSGSNEDSAMEEDIDESLSDDYTLFTPKDLRRVLRVITKDLQIWESADTKSIDWVNPLVHTDDKTRKDARGMMRYDLVDDRCDGTDALAAGALPGAVVLGCVVLPEAQVLLCGRGRRRCSTRSVSVESVDGGSDRQRGLEVARVVPLKSARIVFVCFIAWCIAMGDQAGALPLLVALLRAGTEQGTTNAAAAVARLANNMPTRALIVEAGALPLLVALLRAGTEQGNSYSALAIARLAEESPTRMLILGEGALPLLVALLNAGTESGKVYAAYAIAWLAEDAPTRTLILGEGALPLLVALLRAGTESGKANAADAISWLAHDAPTRALIVEAGALPPLIALVSPSRACSDAGAGKNAGDTFQHLAADPRSRELAEEHGAAGALAAAAHAPGCEWAEAARTALRALCPTQGDAERALGDTHLKSCALVAERDLENCALRAERDTLAGGYDSLASLAGPVEKGHDRLLRGGTVEDMGGIVKPDPDFSSAAHLALLGQLHAMGQAPLPAFLDVWLELLCLAAKVRGAPSASPDAAACVFERCMRAVRNSLCAGNCFAVLLQLKPCAAEMLELVDAAHAVVAENVIADIALKQAGVNAEQASRLVELDPQADGSRSTRKRPRAVGGEGSWRRGGNVAPEEGGWRRTPRRAADNAAHRTPTPAFATAADKIVVELCVSTLLLCKPGQGVQVEPRCGPFGLAYAVERYVEKRVPREWNSGACGVAAAGDDWEARLIGLCAHLAKVLPDGTDFEIVPWFVSEGRVMFVLTARVAIAPQQQRAAGGKRRGAARAQAHVPAPADAFADAPADAGIEELVVLSPVADAATGVAAAPAADARADAPAAEVLLLSQTLQVLLPALPLHDSGIYGNSTI
ncbi:hypothetical protein T492DRAFT_868932 [Pavlovales sp. CCMP2436]|nr:hypothetical protein T492DRAFT_868932 [Pavlovales sp. CCMP2436]